MFVENFDPSPGDTVSARAEDASLNVFPLDVDFVGKVPGLDQFTQVIVRLHAGIPANQSIFVSVTLQDKTSNKARVRMK